MEKSTGRKTSGTRRGIPFHAQQPRLTFSSVKDMHSGYVFTIPIFGNILMRLLLWAYCCYSSSYTTSWIFAIGCFSAFICCLLYTSKSLILPCHYRYPSVIRPHPLWLRYSISFITNFTSYADFQHEQTAGMYYYIWQMTSCTATANQTSTLLPKDHSTTFLVSKLSSNVGIAQNVQVYLCILKCFCEFSFC